MSARAALTLSYACRYTRSYFTLRHTRSTNTLSRHAHKLAALSGVDDFGRTVAGKGRIDHFPGVARFQRDATLCARTRRLAMPSTAVR